MADQDARMVLRTVYLTPEVDEKLRVGAFQAGRSKNDLIRDAITQFLTGSGEPAKTRSKAAAIGVAKKATARKEPAKHRPVKAAADIG